MMPKKKYLMSIFIIVLLSQIAAVGPGVKFRVNSTTAEWQSDPAVAMAADGAFVVAWDEWEVTSYE